MSGFDRKDIVNFYDTHEDFVKRQRFMKNKDREFLQVTDPDPSDPKKEAAAKKRVSSLQTLRKNSKTKTAPDNSMMVEGVITTYKVSHNGAMQKTNEAPLNMGRKFMKAENGNMMLTRSADKKQISVTSFDREDRMGDYFKVKAWKNKLQLVEIPECVNVALNSYYEQFKDTFDQLIEVQLVGRCKYLKLSYIESKQRTIQEQQDYEREIDAAIQKTNRGQDTQRANFEKRKTPRKATKHVFFSIETGAIFLEYGGVRKPMEV